MGYLTSKGYYIDAISGDDYSIDFEWSNYSVRNYNDQGHNLSFKYTLSSINSSQENYIKNTVDHAYRYFPLEKIYGGIYFGSNIFERARILETDHNHPWNDYASDGDKWVSSIYNIPGCIIGPSGKITYFNTV